LDLSFGGFLSTSALASVPCFLPFAFCCCYFLASCFRLLFFLTSSFNITYDTAVPPSPFETGFTQLPASRNIFLTVSGGSNAPAAYPFNMFVLKTVYLPCSNPWKKSIACSLSSISTGLIAKDTFL
jgi:hypothetical protein